MNEPTETPDDLRRFTFAQQGAHTAEVTLDGVDVTEALSGFTMHAGDGEPYPEVLLRLHPRAALDQKFATLARVRVTEVETDPGPAAAVFLAAIDAETLEDAALQRTDLDPGPHGLTKAMLAQLREWASGRS